MAVRMAGFQQQHARAAFGDQPRGGDAARGAAADDDVVETLLHHARLRPRLRQARIVSRPGPVEGDAVAGPVGRDREALLDPQRLGDVALEAEAVRFEIAAVRAGGEQMHGHVMRAMAWSPAG